MRATTRVLLAGFVSVLVVGVLPAQSAEAAPVKPGMVYCCR
jgi:hypothetical protein